jgi:hypothetical protein
MRLDLARPIVLPLLFASLAIACASGRNAQVETIASTCYRGVIGTDGDKPARCVIAQDVDEGEAGLIRCLGQPGSDPDVAETSAIIQADEWGAIRNRISLLERQARQNPPRVRSNTRPHWLILFGPSIERTLGCLGPTEVEECGPAFSALWHAVEELGERCS